MRGETNPCGRASDPIAASGPAPLSHDSAIRHRCTLLGRSRTKERRTRTPLPWGRISAPAPHIGQQPAGDASTDGLRMLPCPHDVMALAPRLGAEPASAPNTPPQIRGEMTNSKCERKEFDEKRDRFSRLADKVDPVETERKIAAYNRKKAAALTSTTDTTANPDGAGKATTSKTTSTPEVPDSEIEATMKTAADSDAVVAAVSLEEWARMNDGDRCPKHRIANAAALIAGLPNIPHKTETETRSLLSKLYDGEAKWILFDRIGIEIGAAVTTVLDEDRTVAMLHTPFDVHRKHMALPRESRPRHPLGPLLEDFWQEHLPRPAGRFAEVKPRRRGSLARLSGLSDQTYLSARLPGRVHCAGRAGRAARVHQRIHHARLYKLDAVAVPAVRPRWRT